MTDEELDLLASSYLDGEATPEEVARIEREPALRDRVEELRVAQSAMRAPVPQPARGLKERQLAAALTAFDALDAADRRTTLLAVDESADDGSDASVDGDPAADTDTDTGPVIDLRSRRAEREEREAVAAGRMRWLSAVAGVLVFAAGAVFLVSQVGGGGDDEFAGDVATDQTDAGSSAEVQAAPAADDAAADDAAAETADSSNLVADGEDAAIDSEAMEPDAEGDFALDDEAIEEAEEDADAADESSADTAAAPFIRDDLAEEGFFGDEPVAGFATVPSSDDLLDEVDLPWRGPDSSACAARAELPDGAEVIAYLPIEIPDTDGDGSSGSTRVVEALYLTIGSESQVILVDPDTCEGF